MKGNATETPPTPNISMKNGNVGVYGEPMIFTCCVLYPAGTKIKLLWTTPNEDVAFYVNDITPYFVFTKNAMCLILLILANNNTIYLNLFSRFIWAYAKQENRVRISETVVDNQTSNEMWTATSTMVVNNLNASQDIGTYQCMVRDISNQTVAAALQIVRVMSKYSKSITF